MNLRILETEAEQYNQALEKFMSQQKLPASWFDSGYDHFAVKAYAPDHYDDLVSQYKYVARRIYETNINNRRIATVQLLGEYSLDLALSATNNPDPISWVELMEARPEEQDGKTSRLDHAEIYALRGLMPVRKILGERLVDFLPQGNDSHEWLSILINARSDELKFTDRRLEDIVNEGLEQGRSRVIHAR